MRGGDIDTPDTRGLPAWRLHTLADEAHSACRALEKEIREMWVQRLNEFGNPKDPWPQPIFPGMMKSFPTDHSKRAERDRYVYWHREMRSLQSKRWNEHQLLKSWRRERDKKEADRQTINEHRAGVGLPPVEEPLVLNPRPIIGVVGNAFRQEVPSIWPWRSDSGIKFASLDALRAGFELADNDRRDRASLIISQNTEIRELRDMVGEADARARSAERTSMDNGKDAGRLRAERDRLAADILRLQEKAEQLDTVSTRYVGLYNAVKRLEEDERIARRVRDQITVILDKHTNP
jgi:hypothetical protein